jgi:hypothetical protein
LPEPDAQVSGSKASTTDVQAPVPDAHDVHTPVHVEEEQQ